MAVDMTAAGGALLAAGTGTLRRDNADVARTRERQRKRRVAVLLLVLGSTVGYAVARMALGLPVAPFSMPAIDWLVLAPIAFFVLLILLLVGTHVGSGRSPHVLLRPEQIDVHLSDVVGIDVVKEEVTRSLDLFLGYGAARSKRPFSPTVTPIPISYPQFIIVVPATLPHLISALGIALVLRGWFARGNGESPCWDRIAAPGIRREVVQTGGPLVEDALYNNAGALFDWIEGWSWRWNQEYSHSHSQCLSFRSHCSSSLDCLRDSLDLAASMGSLGR